MATTPPGGGDASDSGPVPTSAPSVDFAQYRARRLRLRLLDLLDLLVAAMERRDQQAVWDVLDEEEAVRCFPQGIREEALTIARLPRTSFRAPMRVFRYYHQLQQLAGDPIDVSEDPHQLSLELTSPGLARPTLAFPARPAPTDDPRRGGSDRRRSGSR